MSRNVPFTIDEHVLDLACEAAKAEGSSLCEQLHCWVDGYARQRQAQRVMEVAEHIRKNYQMTSPKPMRDEMNARR